MKRHSSWFPISLLFAAFPLHSCVSSEKIASVYNQELIKITCPLSRSKRSCHDKARELCPQGYAVVPTHTPDMLTEHVNTIQVHCRDPQKQGSEASTAL